MATKLPTVSLVLLGAAALLGCVSPHLARETTPSADALANVHLYLSNESTEPSSTVVLSVYVDGVLEVRRSMRSVWANPNTPHGIPDEIPLRLSSGSHTIRVVAEGTTASAETRITVGDVPVHVSAAFGLGSCGQERPSTEANVTIHVLPERPGWC